MPSSLAAALMVGIPRRHARLEQPAKRTRRALSGERLSSTRSGLISQNCEELRARMERLRDRKARGIRSR